MGATTRKNRGKSNPLAGGKPAQHSILQEYQRTFEKADKKAEEVSTQKRKEEVARKRADTQTQRAFDKEFLLLLNEIEHKLSREEIDKQLNRFKSLKEKETQAILDILGRSNKAQLKPILNTKDPKSLEKILDSFSLTSSQKDEIIVRKQRIDDNQQKLNHIEQNEKSEATNAILASLMRMATLTKETQGWQFEKNTLKLKAKTAIYAHRITQMVLTNTQLLLSEEERSKPARQQQALIHSQLIDMLSILPTGGATIFGLFRLVPHKVSQTYALEDKISENYHFLSTQDQTRFCQTMFENYFSEKDYKWYERFLSGNADDKANDLRTLLKGKNLFDDAVFLVQEVANLSNQLSSLRNRTLFKRCSRVFKKVVDANTQLYRRTHERDALNRLMSITNYLPAHSEAWDSLLPFINSHFKEFSYAQQIRYLQALMAAKRQSDRSFSVRFMGNKQAGKFLNAIEFVTGYIIKKENPLHQQVVTGLRSDTSKTLKELVSEFTDYTHNRIKSRFLPYSLSTIFVKNIDQEVERVNKIKKNVEEALEKAPNHFKDPFTDEFEKTLINLEQQHNNEKSRLKEAFERNFQALFSSWLDEAKIATQSVSAHESRTEYAEAGIDTTGSILPGEVTGEIVSKLGTGVRVVGAVYKKTTLAYAVQGLVQSEVEELVNKVTEKLYQFLEEQIHSFRSPSDAITFAEYCHQKLQYIMAEYPKMKVNNEFPLTHGYTREQQMDIYAQRLLEKLTTPNESLATRFDRFKDELLSFSQVKINFEGGFKRELPDDVLTVKCFAPIIPAPKADKQDIQAENTYQQQTSERKAADAEQSLPDTVNEELKALREQAQSQAEQIAQLQEMVSQLLGNRLDPVPTHGAATVEDEEEDAKRIATDQQTKPDAPVQARSSQLQLLESRLDSMTQVMLEQTKQMESFQNIIQKQQEMLAQQHQKMLEFMMQSSSIENESHKSIGLAH